MQEHTILPLTPLGIHRKTTIGHCAEGARRRASLIQIPTLKHISGIRVFRNIIVSPIAIIGGDVRTVSDSFHHFRLNLIDFLHRNIVAVYIRTIHKIERVGIAVIAYLQRV